MTCCRLPGRSAVIMAGLCSTPGTRVTSPRSAVGWRIQPSLMTPLTVDRTSSTAHEAVGGLERTTRFCGRTIFGGLFAASRVNSDDLPGFAGSSSVPAVGATSTIGVACEKTRCGPVVAGNGDRLRAIRKRPAAHAIASVGAKRRIGSEGRRDRAAARDTRSPGQGRSGVHSPACARSRSMSDCSCFIRRECSDYCARSERKGGTCRTPRQQVPQVV